LEVARLRSALRRHAVIALDSCIFIYQWEASPTYSPLTDCIFSSVEQGHPAAFTSTITMTELLVHPYRKRDEDQVDELMELFSTFPNLDWIVPDLEIARNAARIRADHGLKTPDALQAATAVHANATALITNDPIFRRMKDFDSLLLDEFL
jgi:predicted nucleic acid-binding protein